MRSTGEVMGSGRSFGEAYAKAQLASGVVLPTSGTALLSVRDQDKPAAIEIKRAERKKYPPENPDLAIRNADSYANFALSVYRD